MQLNLSHLLSFDEPQGHLWTLTHVGFHTCLFTIYMEKLKQYLCPFFIYEKTKFGDLIFNFFFLQLMSRSAESQNVRSKLLSFYAH